MNQKPLRKSMGTKCTEIFKTTFSKKAKECCWIKYSNQVKIYAVVRPESLDYLHSSQPNPLFLLQNTAPTFVYLNVKPNVYPYCFDDCNTNK